MPFILQSLREFWPVISTVSGRLLVRYCSERRTIVFHSPIVLGGTITLPNPGKVTRGRK